MILEYANNATTTLAIAIGTGDTTIVVASGSGGVFPTTGTNLGFYLTLLDAATQLVNEICLCTARTGDTLTVVRAQQGTSAHAYEAGSLVTQLVTAGDMSSMIQITSLQVGTYSFVEGTGTGNAIVATLPSNSTVLTNGFYIVIGAPDANTSGVTLSLTLGSTVLPTTNIIKDNGVYLVAGDIPSISYPIQLFYNINLGAWVMTNPATNSGGGSGTGLLATNGYWTLPGGLIYQWGIEAGTTLGAAVNTTPYNIPFPVACFNVQLTGWGYGNPGGQASATINGPSNYASLGIISRTNFSWIAQNLSNLNGFHWFAIGH